jgi:hypothetical protein
MRLIAAVVIIVLLPIALFAGSEREDSKFTRHYRGSIFQVTEEGLYSVEVVIKEKKLTKGNNTVDLIIHDRNDGDIVGADIKVVPWMPSMGHGVSDKPVINERGGGLYRVENINLIMGGHWELRIYVKRGEIEDRVVFAFPDVMAEQKHEHAMHAPEPVDIDLSTTRHSSAHTFQVSYESRLSPIVINKIHIWELKVLTAGGKPLQGAEITLDGDMPEHGHGMPTEPEVTQEYGGGIYLVEGMKFSMPGWWVVNVHIKKESTEDSVTFNLFLK